MRDHHSLSLSNILGGLDKRSNKVMIFFDIHMSRFFFLIQGIYGLKLN